MKLLTIVLLSMMIACVPAKMSDAPTPGATPVKSAKPVEPEIRPAECQCSPEHPEEPGVIDCTTDGDLDGDCVCTGSDNCPGTPNCDRADADGDGFGDACDIMPNTANPEAVIASLDTRIDALEAAQSTITALQADVALLVTALAEVRAKYPEHFHGLLGLNGEPVGNNGDLGYSLPGDP